MHFVDHALMPRRTRRRSVPQVNAGSITVAFSIPGALSRRSMERSAFVPDAIAEMGVAPLEVANDLFRVRIEH